MGSKMSMTLKEYMIPIIRVSLNPKFDKIKRGTIVTYQGCLAVYRILGKSTETNQVLMEPCFCQGDRRTAFVYELNLVPNPVSIAEWKKIVDRYKGEGGLYDRSDDKTLRVGHKDGRVVYTRELYG